MKTIPILFLALGIILIISQAFIMRSTEKTEQRAYDVILQDGDFEIRYYPKATLATVNMKANSYNDVAYPGFRKLAGYIFGSNKENVSIPMTAPVEMSMSDTGSVMSFVMPRAYQLNTLPKPNDSSVMLHESEPEYCAVYKFGGYAGDDKIKKNTDKLRDLLTQKNINAIGAFRYLGYNAPYQVVGRRNEIVVKIDYVKVEG